MLTGFLSDRKGNFALMSALAMVPILGAAGLAVDFTRAVNARAFLQSLADEAALSGARGGTTGDTSKILDFAKMAAEQASGYAFKPTNVVVKDKWLSAQDYRVTIHGTIATTILSGLPGFPDAVAIAVGATAEAGKPKYTYTAPKFKSLDPSAWDYNQLAVYCFDPEKASDPATHGRSQEVIIADDAGTNYTYAMPTCAAGEYLSFHLHNVRDALHDAQNTGGGGSLLQKINKIAKNADKYDYYTDTVITGGVEKYSLPEPTLETVLCDTYQECTGTSQGGIVPEGANRTPESATQPCSAGKFLYYGWEDRPPSQGSDRDYNDIRIVMACPSVTIVGYDSTRLIQ